MSRRLLKTLLNIALCIGLTLVLSTPASAIPAFARKYGLRCTSCHESWPVLNDFGRNFRDNGYQLREGKDDTVNSNNAYWPVSVHITPSYVLYLGQQSADRSGNQDHEHRRRRRCGDRSADGRRTSPRTSHSSWCRPGSPPTATCTWSRIGRISRACSPIPTGSTCASASTRWICRPRRIGRSALRSVTLSMAITPGPTCRTPQAYSIWAATSWASRLPVMTRTSMTRYNVSIFSGE